MDLLYNDLASSTGLASVKRLYEVDKDKQKALEYSSKILTLYISQWFASFVVASTQSRGSMTWFRWT